MRLFDEKFRNNKINYIVQSLLAAFAVAFAVFLFNVTQQAVIVASFAASGFIAFTMPHNKISRPRHLIGGYLIGIIAGCSVHFITEIPIPHDLTNKFVDIISCGLAVGAAMLLMTIMDMEHPPAASLALGLAMNNWTHVTIILIIITITMIAVFKRITKRWMIDLI